MLHLNPNVFKIHCGNMLCWVPMGCLLTERTENLILWIVPEMFGQDGEGTMEETMSLAKNILSVGFVSTRKQELFAYCPLQTFM